MERASVRSEVNIKIMCIASTENPKKKKKKYA